MSGTCATKTCHRKPVPFNQVAENIYRKFQLARLVATTNAGYGLMVHQRKGKRPPEPGELVYYEKSPTFCAADKNLNWGGTKGRECEVTNDPRVDESCYVLCCQRGHKSLHETITYNCNCTKNFPSFKCEQCNLDIVRNVCK